MLDEALGEGLISEEQFERLSEQVREQFEQQAELLDEPISNYVGGITQRLARALGEGGEAKDALIEEAAAGLVEAFILSVQGKQDEATTFFGQFFSNIFSSENEEGATGIASIFSKLGFG